MKTVTFTEFRKQASGLFTEVEQGESYVIIRHGRPIAEITPYSGGLEREPAWKRPGVKIENGGATLSSLILEERESYQ